MIRNEIKRLITALSSKVNPFKHKTIAQSLSKELAVWKVTPWQPGHYYSPVHNPKEVSTISVDYSQTLPGIDLNETGQIELLNKIATFYNEDIFPHKKVDGKRYYFDNDFFDYSDAIFLHSLMRYYKPRKIIEIGSGFSSALMLDTNALFFENRINLHFIEPYPEERLLTLIDINDHCSVHKEFVQNIKNEFWDNLEEDDILFIDSSHVSKYKSDVNYLFFEVLPRLKKGVIVHVHDIFFPFEYPHQWLQQGRAWNEAYLLRAFLQFNSAFEILLFPSFLEGKHNKWFSENMPLCLNGQKTINVSGKISLMNTNGQSIYIRKIK
jgi:predicted O-methyltransferase YrrM